MVQGDRYREGKRSERCTKIDRYKDKRTENLKMMRLKNGGMGERKQERRDGE